MASTQRNHNYYIYFILQPNGRTTLLKVGHTKNLKQRKASYETPYVGVTLIHSIEVSAKPLALAMERGFVRILSEQNVWRFGREWFAFQKPLIPILKSWGIEHEMV